MTGAAEGKLGNHVRALLSGSSRRYHARLTIFGARVRTSGILGAEVLRRFVVTIDLRKRKLHLVPADVAAPETAPAPAS
jgi:hypothetical protein